LRLLWASHAPVLNVLNLVPNVYVAAYPKALPLHPQPVPPPSSVSGRLPVSFPFFVQIFEPSVQRNAPHAGESYMLLPRLFLLELVPPGTRALFLYIGRRMSGALFPGLFFAPLELMVQSNRRELFSPPEFS